MARAYSPLVVAVSAVAAAAALLGASAQAAQAAPQAPPPEAVQAMPLIVDVRVHGNYRTPDDEVLRIAGIAPGQPLPAGGADTVAGRLRASGRFDDVDVRVRHRSLTDESQIAIIVWVVERPGVEKGGVMPGPLARVRRALMASPSFEYVDGYGVTAGARVSAADVLGKGGHVAVPLSAGSTRRAAVELDKTWPSGLVRRLVGSAAVVSRENPAYGVRDRRGELTLAASRPLASWLSAGARAAWADVAFGGVRDRLVTYGATVTVDTRTNPAFPRNAVHVIAGWEAVRPDAGPPASRVTIDARAYAGLVGSTVLALRARSETADAPLPAYERRLLGGFSSLRGFRAGAFTGDNIAAVSAELRLPFGSPMHIGQSGLTLFADTGAAYEHGTRLEHADRHTGVGIGWYLRAPLVQLDLAVARGDDRRTRFHVSAGLRF